jgi:hypothetical protein
MSEAIVRQNKDKAAQRSNSHRYVRLLHFGLDTPKSMTLGYIANLSANK